MISNFWIFNYEQTNVPNIRLAYRHQTLLTELEMIKGHTIVSSNPALAGLSSGDIDHRPLPLPTADAVAAKAMQNSS